MNPQKILLYAISLLILVGIAMPGKANAAGMITHAWIADEAVESVEDPTLQSLLTFHNFELLSGGSFPDTGYAAGGYGEISHWERFVDAYIADLRARPNCGDLSDPLGPCAPQVAHMMGVAAHGVGDEMWDWLFEPAVTDHGEEPLHPLAPPEVNGVIGNIEYAMDTIALADHFRWAGSGYYVPPPTELTPIYDAAGHGHTTEADLVAGYAVGSGALTAERLGGAADAPRVREQMPWSSAHMHSYSGGVFDTAEGVAGYYDTLWKKLLDDTPPAPKVAAVHPEDGETGLPYLFYPDKTSPGPHTGGAELRILAVISSAVDSASVTRENFQLLGPDGSTIKTERGYVISRHERERRAADPLAIKPMDGFPRPGPYGNGDGTHTIMTYPAHDLEACTTYTALLTTGIKDWAELAINAGKGLEEDFTWSFTTRSSDGKPCPKVIDPPVDPPVDPPICRGQAATVWVADEATGILRGTKGADVIVGSSEDDAIRAGGGDDLICSRSGDDMIHSGKGDDEVHAKAGNDRVRSNGGNDLIQTNAGDDFINAGVGIDVVHAGAGDDELRGNSGNDRLHGKAGDDNLRGGTGKDLCNGGVGGRDQASGCETRRGIE